MVNGVYDAVEYMFPSDHEKPINQIQRFGHCRNYSVSFKLRDSGRAA